MIFNRAWTGQEVNDYYVLGTFDDTGLVYQNKYGTDNGSRIGQILTDETTAPAGSPNWLSVTNGPISPPNIGKIYTNMAIPFLLKYVITAMTPQKSIENDLSAFRINYGIGTGQTGGGEEGGGQTGGDETERVVAVNADAGDGNTLMKDLVAAAVAAGCGAGDAFLIAGDDAYNKTISGSLGALKPVDDKQGSNRAKCRVAIGNHDTENGKDADWRSHFGTSKNYFSFEIGNIHITVIDGENSPTGSTQKNWIDADLKAAAASSKIDWIFVMFHMPLYTASNSHHDPDEGNMRSTYHPMFDKYEVDHVLCGHVHSIQRTYPIRNNKDNSPTVVTRTGGPYDFSKAGHGSIHWINGTLGHDSGGDLYKLSNTPSYNVYQNDDDNLMLIFKTSNNGKTMTCSFIDVDGNVKNSCVVNK
jgi:3',5'-cyclic AMP phosphodiesterase CpdA